MTPGDLPHTDRAGAKYNLDFYLAADSVGRWRTYWHVSEATRPAGQQEVALWIRLPKAVRAVAIAVGKETRTCGNS